MERALRPFFDPEPMKRTMILMLLAGMTCPAAAQYLFDAARADRLTAAWCAGDARASEAVAGAQAEAEELLSMLPATVADKKVLPPSGDARDYMTLSPYWWPDPSQADGLPYIRRDGERNPEVYDCPERENADRLGKAARTLALLYRVTGEERYACKCAELLRAWFLDPERGMNPNLTYAQLIRGRTTIRGTGIIDGRRLGYALCSARLIEGSSSWTEADRAELKAWAGAFLYWLEHSVNGRKELAARNNHGLWYDAIRIMTASAAGEEERVREIAERSLAPRFAQQVAPDGSLPEELARTLSLHYTAFALEAVAVARNVALAGGYDLWTLPEAQRALAFAAPYFEQPATWPHAQIKPFERRRGAVLLHEAGLALGRTEWVEAARRIGYGDGGPADERMLCFELR